MPRHSIPAALCLAAVLALSGCQSDEERAEGYYQSGLALLAAGDPLRAEVEFRNVFLHNGFHKEARAAYAQLLVDQGEPDEAYRQYLRLIEQYPDTVEVRLILARMALALGNWDEVERHGRAALALAPDLAEAQALALALDYRTARQARDTASGTALAARARALLAKAPEDIVLLRIVIDDGLNSPDPQVARPDLEHALTLDPGNLDLNTRLLRLLALAQDETAVGDQLRRMVERFPAEEAFRQSLVRWYLARRDLDGAEAFLRAQAGKDVSRVPENLAVVQFLNSQRDRKAGRVELARLISDSTARPEAAIYGAFLATMDFEEGQTEAALTRLQALLEGAEANDQTRTLMAMRARMLDALRSPEHHAEAMALVAEVLAADPTQVEALKLRAAWAIDQDRAGEAILDLRTALGQAPRDAQVMTLLAAAHERDGNLDLAGEQLAKAVEASGAAAADSLRYARFLQRQGRLAAAETVLTDARRVAPADLQVLEALAQILLEGRKWPQVQAIIAELRQLDFPQAEQAAQQLQAAILMGENRVDEGLALLSDMAGQASDDSRAVTVVVMAQLRAGKADEARAFLDTALAKTPDDAALRLLGANVDAVLGRVDQAEATYRALIDQDPQSEVPVRMLYGLLLGEGRLKDAADVLAKALIQMPDHPILLLIRAGELEQAGDFEGAIRIHEALYAQDTSNIIAANNLASMITTYRDDAESLARAQVVARRLRGSEEPAFQDTYGWIAYRRGDLTEALRHLEPAAAGLPGDPMVQFHLGMVYADLGRRDQAVAQLTRALELGEGRPLPQLDRARSRLAELAAK